MIFRYLTPRIAASALFFLLPTVLCQADPSAVVQTPQNKSAAEIRDKVTRLYERGNRFLDAHRYAEAERSFLDALKLAPDISAIHHGLGLVYVQTQDYELAVLHFEEVLKRDPNQVKALYSLSKAYAAIGEIERAKEGYRRVIELDPKLEAAYQDLAGIYYREKKWDPALEYLGRAKSLNPRSSHTLMLIGVTGIHAGRQDIALDSVTELRAIKQMDEARRLEFLIYSAKNEPKSS